MRRFLQVTGCSDRGAWWALRSDEEDKEKEDRDCSAKQYSPGNMAVRHVENEGLDVR